MLLCDSESHRDAWAWTGSWPAPGRRQRWIAKATLVFTARAGMTVIFEHLNKLVIPAQARMTAIFERLNNARHTGAGRYPVFGIVV